MTDIAIPSSARPTDGQFSLPLAKESLGFTGERMTTEMHGQVAFEHFHRYCLARDLCAGRDVLDIASGEGYGSAFIATTARSVIGVEIDPASVAHASASYVSDNLQYRQGNALDIPLDPASVDVVVSFETLEHLPDQTRFLQEIRRVLRPGGLLIVSSPDRAVYSGPGQPANKYHVLELTRAEFAGLLGRHFVHHRILAQRAVIGSLIAADDQAGWRSFDRRSPDLIEAMPGLSRAFYLIAVASDAELPPLASSAYIENPSIDDLLTAAAEKPRLPELKARNEELWNELDRVSRSGSHERLPPMEEVPSAQFERLRSLEEWQAFIAAGGLREGAATIEAITRHALRHGVRSRYLGPIGPGQVEMLGEDPREGLFAQGFNSRLRAVLEVLAGEEMMGDVNGTRIYAHEALTPFALLLRGRYIRFLGSEYAADDATRERLWPIPAIDIERSGLPDAQLDLVLTNEVLEHVADLEAALRDTARILKPGGKLIGTFPFDSGKQATDQRARIVDGRLEHLATPEYHGNPTDPEGGSLVFQVMGWDVLDLCRKVGFSDAQMVYISSHEAGITARDTPGIFVLEARR